MDAVLFQTNSSSASVSEQFQQRQLLTNTYKQLKKRLHSHHTNEQTPNRAKLKESLSYIVGSNKINNFSNNSGGYQHESNSNNSNNSNRINNSSNSQRESNSSNQFSSQSSTVNNRFFQGSPQQLEQQFGNSQLANNIGSVKTKSQQLFTSQSSQLFPCEPKVSEFKVNPSDVPVQQPLRAKMQQYSQQSQQKQQPQSTVSFNYDKSLLFQPCQNDSLILASEKSTKVIRNILFNNKHKKHNGQQRSQSIDSQLNSHSSALLSNSKMIGQRSREFKERNPTQLGVLIQKQNNPSQLEVVQQKPPLVMSKKLILVSESNKHSSREINASTPRGGIRNNQSKQGTNQVAVPTTVTERVHSEGTEINSPAKKMLLGREEDTFGDSLANDSQMQQNEQVLGKQNQQKQQFEYYYVLDDKKYYIDGGNSTFLASTGGGEVEKDLKSNSVDLWYAKESSVFTDFLADGGSSIHNSNYMNKTSNHLTTGCRVPRDFKEKPIHYLNERVRCGILRTINANKHQKSAKEFSVSTAQLNVYKNQIASYSDSLVTKQQQMQGNDEQQMGNSLQSHRIRPLSSVQSRAFKGNVGGNNHSSSSRVIQEKSKQGVEASKQAEQQEIEESNLAAGKNGRYMSQNQHAQLMSFDSRISESLKDFMQGQSMEINLQILKQSKMSPLLMRHSSTSSGSRVKSKVKSVYKSINDSLN